MSIVYKSKRVSKVTRHGSPGTAKIDISKNKNIDPHSGKGITDTGVNRKKVFDPAEMMAIKTGIKEIQKKRELEMGNNYRLAGHRQQQRDHPILNQIYDILVELHKLGKETTLC